MIIGLTGKNGSGKGEFADFLISRGFQYYSLSDILRETLKTENQLIERASLIKTGNSLRKEFGPSVLADKIIEKLDTDKYYVIDSIRNPYEAKSLKKLSRFSLIDVTAPVNIRFDRCQKRGREKAETSFDEFIRMEEKELKNSDPYVQQLEKVAQLADWHIDNSSTLSNLHDQIIKILQTLSQKFKRPKWDDYFMNIAKVIAERSNCIKRHVAAVIVKDKRIISTGYNGTPRGVKNCDEGGCPRCNSWGQSGDKLGECICSHAEENAITQAAYHGVSIKNAIIYTTFSPCLMCTKMIINSGIQEVVYDAKYALNHLELSLLKEAGVNVRTLSAHQN